MRRVHSGQPDAVPFLAKAARPTLFDVVAEPDLMISLVLADLMEPSLWALAARLRQQWATQDSPYDRAHKLQQYLDHHLVHWGPREMPDLWGTLSIEEERARLGAPCVDYAIRAVLHNIEYERGAGVMPERDDIVPLIGTGWFPDYEYATLDIIRAHRNRFRGKKHKPMGITSCADEATLISSLSVAAGLARLVDLVVIGSPAHYSVMLRNPDGPYWFSGKHEVFSAADWRAALAREPGLTPQFFFSARADLDRIITSKGTFLFATLHSSIPQPDLEAIIGDIGRFFGGTLDQLAPVDLGAVTYEDRRSDGLDDLALGADSTTACAAVRACAVPGSVADGAVYGYRSVDVDAPQAYLRAALRGHLVREAAAQCNCRDEAIALAKTITGTSSIFGDRERLAMPDEVLLFQTGTDRDKALLVFCLIALAEAGEQEGTLELVFTRTGSFLGFGSSWIDAQEWQSASRPTDAWHLHFAHADLVDQGLPHPR